MSCGFWLTDGQNVFDWLVILLYGRRPVRCGTDEQKHQINQSGLSKYINDEPKKEKQLCEWSNNMKKLINNRNRVLQEWVLKWVRIFALLVPSSRTGFFSFMPSNKVCGWKRSTVCSRPGGVKRDDLLWWDPKRGEACGSVQCYGTLWQAAQVPEVEQNHLNH